MIKKILLNKFLFLTCALLSNLIWVTPCVSILILGKGLPLAKHSSWNGLPNLTFVNGWFGLKIEGGSIESTAPTIYY